MRTLYAFVFVLTCTIGTLAAQEFDQRLLAGFTVEELNTMKAENPDELELMKVFCKEGFKVMDYPKEKKGALDPSTALDVNDLSVFNPLVYGLRPHDHARIYYPLKGNNDKMIAILPRTELQIK
jgi:hypothetical protein